LADAARFRERLDADVTEAAFAFFAVGVTTDSALVTVAGSGEAASGRGGDFILTWYVINAPAAGA
jgi:hypothetical protein